MEGGRGGGRGKGKKGKPTKKKASNSAKKVPASQANVQVTTVSAQDLATTATHEPIMFKSKRKRMRKATSTDAFTAASAQSTIKSTVAKDAPTKKEVAGLAPSLAANISLTSGKKKKKRKLNALTGKDKIVGSRAGSIASDTGRTMEATKVLTAIKPKKVVAVLGHGGASSTGSIQPNDSLPAASLKRKRLQSLHAHKKGSIQNQQLHKKESVTTADASLATAPKIRKQVTMAEASFTVPKTKKQMVMATSPPTAVQRTGRGDGVSVSVKKLQVEAVNEQHIDVNNANNMSKVSITKPELVTLARKIAQADDSVKKSHFKLSQADQVQINEINTTLATKDEVGNTAKALNNVEPDVFTISPFASPGTKPPPDVCGPDIAKILFANGSDTKPIATRITTEGIPKATKVSMTKESLSPMKSAQLAPSRPKDENMSDAALVSNVGAKRRHSVTETFARTETLQPIITRTALGSNAYDVVTKEGQQSAIPDETSANDEKFYAPPNTHINVDDSFVYSQAPQITAIVKDDATEVADEVSVASAFENQAHGKEMQVAASNAFNATFCSFDQPDSTAMDVHNTNARKDMSLGVTTQAISGKAEKAEKVDLIMDSHTYVGKIMEDDSNAISNADKNSDIYPAQPFVGLQSRLPNAWGASFGMKPPIHGVLSASRTLSTTPLSSWFLSKGCANFVKHVHFSDDGSSDDDNSTSTLQLTKFRGADKTSPKRKASITKGNAFLESLTHQSSWRTWYGDVDVDNLLDPPLSYVSEKMHEVMVLAPPDPMVKSQVTTCSRRLSKLEMLEADIRREKLRGSAFSLQLLMMLQGKTMSGKSLNEEYKVLLQQ